MTERTPHEAGNRPDMQKLRFVPEETLIAVLKTLPTPITIERKVLEKPRRGRTHYYTYQVGQTTEENPVGIRMGATTDFLDALHLSLQVALAPDTPPGAGRRTPKQSPGSVSIGDERSRWFYSERAREQAALEQSEHPPTPAGYYDQFGDWHEGWFSPQRVQASRMVPNREPFPSIAGASAIAEQYLGEFREEWRQGEGAKREASEGEPLLAQEDDIVRDE